MNFTHGKLYKNLGNLLFSKNVGYLSFCESNCEQIYTTNFSNKNQDAHFFYQVKREQTILNYKHDLHVPYSIDREYLGSIIISCFLVQYL